MVRVVVSGIVGVTTLSTFYQKNELFPFSQDYLFSECLVSARFPKTHFQKQARRRRNGCKRLPSVREPQFCIFCNPLTYLFVFFLKIRSLLIWKSESTLPFQSYFESQIEVDNPQSDHHTKKQLKFTIRRIQHHQHHILPVTELLSVNGAGCQGNLY